MAEEPPRVRLQNTTRRDRKRLQHHITSPTTHDDPTYPVTCATLSQVDPAFGEDNEANSLGWSDFFMCLSDGGKPEGGSAAFLISTFTFNFNTPISIMHVNPTLVAVTVLTTMGGGVTGAPAGDKPTDMMTLPAILHPSMTTTEMFSILPVSTLATTVNNTQQEKGCGGECMFNSSCCPGDFCMVSFCTKGRKLENGTWIAESEALKIVAETDARDAAAEAETAKADTTEAGNGITEVETTGSREDLARGTPNPCKRKCGNQSGKHCCAHHFCYMGKCYGEGL
ncbi:hypothetical protein BDW59DRAFT_158410 [Aspergillus cavernicola]|uniref:Uncharacterized protein n=1 Tax=Aspergillus cavernicola TaxID=176166 RepID=A0ABR4IRV2_9EURO